MGVETVTIYCIGRNYADHAKELGNSIPTEFPIVFMKPGAAAVPGGSLLTLPFYSKSVHYETEMVVRVGFDLRPEAVGVGLDLTARDIQTELKKKGEPWTLAKAFKQSAPIAGFHPARGLDPDDLQIRLTINGQLKQNGFTRDMIFKTGKIVEYLIQHFPLEGGDLIYTGTPAGVGELHAGDQLHVELIEPGRKPLLLSEGIWVVK